MVVEWVRVDLQIRCVKLAGGRSLSPYFVLGPKRDFLPSFLPSSPFQSIALLHSCTHPHTQAHEVHVHRIACRHFGEIGGGGAFLWFDSFFYRISQRSRSDSITWMALLLLLLLRVSLVGTLQPSSFVVRQALFYFTAILPVQKKIVCPSVQNCKLWLCAVTPRTLTMR